MTSDSTFIFILIITSDDYDDVGDYYVGDDRDDWVHDLDACASLDPSEYKAT